MSSHQRVYLGPYIQVFSRMSEQVERTDGCEFPNDCPNSETPFCPKCGMERGLRFLEDRVVTEDPKVEQLFTDPDFIDEFNYEEEGVEEGVSYIFKPNKAISTDREFCLWDLSRAEFDVEDLISSGIAEREKQAYKDTYRKWIARLRDIWPDAKVSWGIVVSWH